ncbi:MAG: hypothetical protein NHB15_19475 [Methanosarcina barkeri]|nr:hypothetical protein [Methanosarcina sp. ERenArc_MAG2]
MLCQKKLLPRLITTLRLIGTLKQEPQGIHDMQHFDVHFYMISLEERDKITASETILRAYQKSRCPEMFWKGMFPQYL